MAAFHNSSLFTNTRGPFSQVKVFKHHPLNFYCESLQLCIFSATRERRLPTVTESVMNHHTCSMIRVIESSRWVNLTTLKYSIKFAVLSTTKMSPCQTQYFNRTQSSLDHSSIAGAIRSWACNYQLLLKKATFYKDLSTFLVGEPALPQLMLPICSHSCLSIIWRQFVFSRSNEASHWLMVVVIFGKLKRRNKNLF